MKKLKYAFYIILVALLGLVIFQNWEYLTAPAEELKLNLWFYKDPPPLTNGAIIAVCVGVSVLIMMLFYLGSRYQVYRAKKLIKKMSAGMEESAASITALQQEVEILKGGSPTLLDDAPDPDESRDSDTETTQATQA